MLRSNFLKSYSVQIKYKLLGSGVLVKANDDNYCYLFTAKHNLKKNKRESLDEIVIDDIDLKKISIIKESNQKISIKELIYEYDDLIVFLIEDKLKGLDKVKILKGQPTDKMQYFFYGYPAKKPEGQLLDKLSSRNDIIDSNKFEVRNRDNTPTKYVEGFSGSGMFTEDEYNVNYLCGIVLQANESYYTITAFNLSTIINTINERLQSKGYSNIPIKKSNFYITNIDGMYSWLLNYHTDNFLVKKVQNIFGKEHRYEDLIEPSEELKYLNQYINSTNQFEVLEDNYIQKLADMYLLGAFVASKYQDKEEALKYLDKARRFRPEYTIFLSEIDKENSKEELFKEGKLAYLEEKYEFSKNCFEKLLSLYLERVEKIEVYEYLIKISKKLERKKETIPFYLELLNLYNEDLEKATVYYELSLIESKDKNRFYASQGINFIQHSTYWEMLYLLYKRLYELTEEKDVYLMLKSTLEKLVQHKIKYKYELSTLNYSETLDKIGIGAYLSSFILLVLSLLLISSSWMNPIIIPIITILFTLMMHFFYKVKGILFFLNNFIFFGGVGSFIFYFS